MPTCNECNSSVGLGCIRPVPKFCRLHISVRHSTFVNFQDVRFEFYFIECRLFGPCTILNVCILCHVPVFCYWVVGVESKFDLGFIRSKYNREQYEPNLILMIALSINGHSLCSILEICLVVLENTYTDGWSDRQTGKQRQRQANTAFCCFNALRTNNS